MKRIFFAVFCCAVASSAPAQPVAPVATPLGAYASSLQSPARVAVDSAGKVYVTDPTAGQVSVFDAFGRLVTTRSGLARPLGIAVDTQGRIYLAEEQLGRVSVFDAQWHLLYRLGQGNGEFQLPNHIALDPASAGSTVYVSDSQANLVKIYVGATLTRWFGGAGTDNGRFDFPTGICVSTNGEIFVVDEENYRMQVFGLTGNFLRTFNLGSSSTLGRFQAAVLDRAGRMYVVDSFQGTVSVFDPASGVALSTIGSFGQLPGQLDAPAGLALDPVNRLLVASANTGRVELYGLDSFLHLTTQPVEGTIVAGTNLTFTVIAGGAGPFTYQWLKDGSAVTSATNASLAIANVGVSDAGAYSLMATGPSGTFTSSVTRVAVMIPPRILTEPASQTVLRGTEVRLAVVTEGSALSYQWLLNGLSLDGANNSTLVLPDVQTFQAGLYNVVVSNAVGAVISDPAVLTVLVPPSVLEIVSSEMDTNQLFHLTLNGDPGFGYSLDASSDLLQWQSLTNLTLDAGLFEYIDADSTNFWNRFYRLRWLP